MTVRREIVDHVDIFTDRATFDTYKRLYRAALEVLGYSVMAESETSISFGVQGADDFGINVNDHLTNYAHIAFSSPSREAVEAFYEKALSTGERPNLPPALHPEFHPHYYAAFVFDPNGNNIEAVYHGSAGENDLENS